MSSLPYELIQHILRHLSSTDIRTCALICRAWVVPAREHVLHTFRVPFTDSRLDALQDILLSPHCTFHLARVHELELFGWPRPAMIRFFELFSGTGSARAGEVGWTNRIRRWFNDEVQSPPNVNPNHTQIFLDALHILSISSLFFPNSVGKHPNSVLPLKSYTTIITSPFRLVRTLRLETVVFASPRQLHEFLVSFVELDALACTGATLSSPSSSRALRVETLRLQDLHIDVQSIRALRGASLGFSNLRNLALDDGNRDKLTDAGVLDVFSEFLTFVNGQVQALSLVIGSTTQFAEPLPPNHHLDLSTSFPHLTHLSLAVPPHIVSFILKQFTRPHRTLRHVNLYPAPYNHRCFHPDKQRCQHAMREIDGLLERNVPRLKVLRVVPMVSNSEEEREAIVLGFPRSAEMGVLEVEKVKGLERRE